MPSRHTLFFLLFLVSFHPAGFPFVQTQVSDEQVWQDFLQWFNARTGVAPGGVLLREYRQKLAADSVTPPVIDQRIAVIENAMQRERSKWARIFYNKAYASATPTFNTEPNAFLVRMVEGLKPGKALDCGMGQGRNAVFLALKDWDVTYSPHGTPKQLYSAPKPGGLFILESFLWDPAERGNVAKPERLPGPNELLRFFKDFRILHYEDVEAVSDFPPLRKTRLVRLMAQKPQMPLPAPR